MSQPTKQIDASKIEIVQIKTLKGNIDADENNNAEQIEAYTYEFGLATGLNPDENLVGLKLTIDITAVGKNDVSLNIKGSYTHEVLFKITDLDDFVVKKENRAVIDVALGSTLIGMAYSTVRGIIFTRTQGTSLGTVILPVINPVDIMKNYSEKEETADKTE